MTKKKKYLKPQIIFLNFFSILWIHLWLSTFSSGIVFIITFGRRVDGLRISVSWHWLLMSKRLKKDFAEPEVHYWRDSRGKRKEDVRLFLLFIWSCCLFDLVCHVSGGDCPPSLCPQLEFIQRVCMVFGSVPFIQRSECLVVSRLFSECEWGDLLCPIYLASVYGVFGSVPFIQRVWVDLLCPVYSGMECLVVSRFFSECVVSVL